MEISDGMDFTSRESCIYILLYMPSLSAEAVIPSRGGIQHGLWVTRCLVLPAVISRLPGKNPPSADGPQSRWPGLRSLPYKKRTLPYYPPQVCGVSAG